MRYRVVRHHEIDVEAPDEEAAREAGVGWEPYRVSVTPLDIEALHKYRERLVDKRVGLKASVRELDVRIAEVDREIEREKWYKDHPEERVTDEMSDLAKGKR